MLFLYVNRFDSPTRKRFEDFYDDYYNLAKIIVNEKIPVSMEHLREDCMQEVWITFSKSFEKILSISDFQEQKRYVGGIMRNVAIDFFNKEISKNASHEAEWAESYDNLFDDFGSRLEFLETERQIDIQKALYQLPENMRYTLELRFYRNFSIHQISEQLDISEAAIYKRIERGLKELEIILKNKGGVEF